MAHRRITNGELRAYINIDGTWRHVYILGSYDQMTLVGEPARMLEFKLSKTSKQTLAAEKSKCHEKKPRTYKRKGSENLA